MSPIYLLTGAPGAGKSTLANALLQHYDFGVHLSVDDLRLMVASGRHDVSPWTEETERQFKVAEEVACGMARTYQSHGFAVVIDGCRSISRLNDIEAESGLEMRKVLLLPSLPINQERNLTRTNKNFDTAYLADIIKFVSDRYHEEDQTGWLVIDNTAISVEETIDRIFKCWPKI